jgi:hypothetical protein
LRGVSKDEPQRTRPILRGFAMKNGEHLRMTVVIVAVTHRRRE